MKQFLLSILLLSVFSQVSAQRDTLRNNNPMKNKPLRERIYVGGDIGLNLGNSFAFFSASPLVGYRLTEKFSVGASIKYQWFRTDFTPSNHIYGGSVFSRYELFDQLLLHAEYEILNVTDYNVFSPTYGGRTNVHVGLVGAGYKYGNGKTYAQLMVLYDLIDDSNSPYRNQYIFGSGVPLFIRGGFIIGL